MPRSRSSSMARITAANVPLPRLASVSSSKPSTLMMGTKFFTRRNSSASSSSMSVALVKAKNSQSSWRWQSSMMSRLRTSGSPPLNRNTWMPSDFASSITRSSSEKLRFSLSP